MKKETLLEESLDMEIIVGFAFKLFLIYENLGML